VVQCVSCCEVEKIILEIFESRKRKKVMPLKIKKNGILKSNGEVEEII